MKAALDILGYYGGPNRKPMQNLNEETRQAIKRFFRNQRFHSLPIGPPSLSLSLSVDGLTTECTPDSRWLVLFLNFIWDYLWIYWIL